MSHCLTALQISVLSDFKSFRSFRCCVRLIFFGIQELVVIIHGWRSCLRYGLQTSGPVSLGHNFGFSDLAQNLKPCRPCLIFRSFGCLHDSVFHSMSQETHSCVYVLCFFTLLSYSFILLLCLQVSNSVSEFMLSSLACDQGFLRG